MKPSVYIETTIPSYLAAKPSRDVVIAGKQETTRQWWSERKNAFSVYISEFVVDESSMGDVNAAQSRAEILDGFPLLLADDEVFKIGKIILDAHAIPQKSAVDALHVAIATRHGIDFLLTWNCTHIANAQILRKIANVIESYGYEVPVICTPDELMGG